MQRWFLLLVNIAVAAVAAVLVLLIWTRCYWYLNSHFFTPTLMAHYDRVGYANADPMLATLVLNAVFAAAVGLILTLFLGFVLRLRWYVLALVLLVVVTCLVRALANRQQLSIVWMLLGPAPYVFATATCIGAWLGERFRTRRVVV
jgi:hypothetical protein